MTTFKAVKGNVRPADLVAISGAGGRGHLAVQYAKIFGGTVARLVTGTPIRATQCLPETGCPSSGP